MMMNVDIIWAPSNELNVIYTDKMLDQYQLDLRTKKLYFNHLSIMFEVGVGEGQLLFGKIGVGGQIDDESWYRDDLIGNL